MSFFIFLWTDFILCNVAGGVYLQLWVEYALQCALVSLTLATVQLPLCTSRGTWNVVTGNSFNITLQRLNAGLPSYWGSWQRQDREPIGTLHNGDIFFVCIKVGDFATAMITCCQVPSMAASVWRICRAVAPSRARRREHTTKLVAGWCWLMVLHAVNPTVKIQASC